MVAYVTAKTLLILQLSLSQNKKPQTEHDKMDQLCHKTAQAIQNSCNQEKTETNMGFSKIGAAFSYESAVGKRLIM